MAEEYFKIEKENHICTITVNRPEKRNAFNTTMWMELADIMHAMAGDDDVRVAVLTGAGDKVFSSGADMAEILAKQEERAQRGPGDSMVERALDAIIDFPNPVIAMVNGYALAGGCELAVNCDLRIASERAHFGMPLAKRGILLSYGLVQRLVNAMGVMYTKELVFTGRIFDAQKALEIGLVNYVVPHDQLLETTMQMAREIADNAPLSVRGFKKMVHKCLSLQEQIDPSDVDELVKAVYASDDVKEGLRAFLEKRAPVFQGK
jgi:enoyl-CoA hydratase